MAAVDPNLPMELDNGVPVELHRIRRDVIAVKIPCHPYRGEQFVSVGGNYSYYSETGIYVGGSEKYQYVLRNVEDDPTLYVPDLV